MRILLHCWNTLCQEDLLAALQKMGHQVTSLYYVQRNYEHETEYEALLEQKLSGQDYDVVMSFNYFQANANACFRKNVPYISWIFDSPTLNLFSKTVRYPTNYIFHFDGAMVERLKALGAQHVYNVPLGVNALRVANVPCGEKQYDVSFVGSLYGEKDQYPALRECLPAGVQGYLDGLLEVQHLLYGCNLLEELCTPEIMKQVMEHCHFQEDSNLLASDAFLLANVFLGIHLTATERRKYLQELAKSFSLTVFTREEKAVIPGAAMRPGVDYQNGMVQVFKESRINLNITLRTIETGVPLRAFDIMGAGGFLLTNYQAQLADYFTPGEDFVQFDSESGLLEAVEYYLHHEDEREQIARNGQNKIQRYYTYEKILDYIFSTVFDR